MDRREFLGSTLVAPAALRAAPVRGPADSRLSPARGQRIAPAQIAPLVLNVRPGEVLLVAGPAGSGKTARALSAALASCRETGQHVAFVKATESFEELADRAGPAASLMFDVSGVSHIRWTEAQAAMAQPRVWIEGRQDGEVGFDYLQEFYGLAPVALSVLRQSPVPFGLAVVDGLAASSLAVGTTAKTLLSEAVLRGQQLQSLTQRVPRVLLVDTGPGTALQAWTTGALSDALPAGMFSHSVPG